MKAAAGLANATLNKPVQYVSTMVVDLVRIFCKYGVFLQKVKATKITDPAEQCSVLSPHHSKIADDTSKVLASIIKTGKKKHLNVAPVAHATRRLLDVLRPEGAIADTVADRCHALVCYHALE